MIARLDLVTVHDYSSDIALIPTNTVQSFGCRNDFLFQPRLLTKCIIAYRGKKPILMREKEKKTAPAKLFLALRLMVWLPALVEGEGAELTGVSRDRLAMIASDESTPTVDTGCDSMLKNEVRRSLRLRNVKKCDGLVNGCDNSDSAPRTY